MPLNAAIEIELDISTQDIGFIRPGDTVTLKIDAFPYIRFGVVKGTITRISEASYAIDINGQPEPAGPFFKVYASKSFSCVMYRRIIGWFPACR